MAKCEMCGNSYRQNDADERAENQLLDPGNFDSRLCPDCIDEMVDLRIDGYYHEDCEECGCRFDPFLEESEYDDHYSWENGIDFRSSWDMAGKIMCASCAIEYVDGNAM